MIVVVQGSSGVRPWGDTEGIAAYAQDIDGFLKERELLEHRAYVESIDNETVVMLGKAVVRYSVFTSQDSPMPEAEPEKVLLND